MKYSLGACLKIAFGFMPLEGTDASPPKGGTPNLFRHALGTFASSNICSIGVLISLCAWTTAPMAADSATAFRAGKLAEMDEAINEAIKEKRCPGGVLWFEHRGAGYHKAYGNRALTPQIEPMTEDTIFDAASLTKVLACTPAIMLLVERGEVKLDERVQPYISEFTGDGKEAITVRQLLTHTSGLRPDIETRSDWHGQPAAIKKA